MPERRLAAAFLNLKHDAYALSRMNWGDIRDWDDCAERMHHALSVTLKDVVNSVKHI